MRKIMALLHVSLDGFAAGPNGELDWITYNDEIEHYSHDLTAALDGSIYGRVTYQMMQSFWTTVPGNPASRPEEIEYAEWLTSATKIVFSRTLEAATWENSVLLRGNNLAAEVAALK